ncbi:MAG: anthranilate synthase component 1 [Acidobacteria bacterium]|nr:anthranilate synthase component 1 [Acidobacteriota bacterium]
MNALKYKKIRFQGCPDPLRLYSHGFNAARPSFLLESADITTRQGEQSLVGLDMALKMECRAGAVQLQALSDWGQALANQLMAAFADRLRADKIIFEPLTDITDENQRLQAPSPVDVLRQCLTLASAGEADSAIHIAGAFAYDFIAFYESIGVVPEDEKDFPDFVFYLPERLLIVHHREQFSELFLFGDFATGRKINDLDVALLESLIADGPFLSAMAEKVPVTEPTSDAEFCQHVLQLKQHIQVGDIFQAVPSRAFFAPCPEPLQAYARLKTQNPSPYMFYFHMVDDLLFGASPETAIKVSGSPFKVEIRPIAGTKPRGFNSDGSIDRDLDSRLEAELRLDEKELAEHMMLIDLARNDIARVSQPGTRYVPRLLTVDRYAYVMHLVSYVEGALRTDLDAFHAYVASMNMGTLVGAPKIRAAQLVRSIEKTRRGPYGGAVGYFNAAGAMDTAIVIRSATVREGIACVRAGAGVVADSVPMEEAHETRRKAASVLRALGGI